MIEFDLSFTQDPQWIAEREKEWQQRLPGYSTMTRKQLNDFRQYFFTGVRSKCFDYEPGTAISNFPALSPASIEYCLQFYAGYKIKDFDLQSIYRVLISDLKNEAEVESRLEVFRYFFGERYDPERKLAKELGPYYQHDKVVPLTADHLFGSIVRTTRWLKKESDEPIWIYLMDYIFSVLPSVDVRLYDVNVEQKANFRIGDDPSGWMYQMLTRLLKDVALGAGPNSPHPADSKKRKFCQDFYNRMENMGHYPGQLKQIWENAKAAANQQSGV